MTKEIEQEEVEMKVYRNIPICPDCGAKDSMKLISRISFDSFPPVYSYRYECQKCCKEIRTSYQLGEIFYKPINKNKSDNENTIIVLTEDGMPS